MALAGSYPSLEETIFPYPSQNVLYFLAPPSLSAPVKSLSAAYHVSIVMIHGMDWENDLSPWPAPSLGKGADFKGRGAEFLSHLVSAVLPTVEKKLPLPPKRRFLTGLSLSGLFALYAGTMPFPWTGIGSISGSFWYDGWTDYIASHRLNPSVETVYISLGRKEKRVRQFRMRQIEKMTKETAAVIQKESAASLLELLPGNHFVHYEDRLSRMVSYLMTGTPKSIDPSYHP
jgi:predicted alpha/beta superfamily hydrolase